MSERKACLDWLKTVGVIGVVFDDNKQIVRMTRSANCTLSFDDVDWALRVWQASANRGGYKLVPVSGDEK